MKQKRTRRLKIIFSIGLLILLQMATPLYAMTLGRSMLYPAKMRTKEGDFYGYINPKGEWVTKPIYEWAMPFSEQIAVVEANNKFGLLDTKGKEILPPTYESISPFKEGRATFVDKEGMGVLNKKGKVLTKKHYSYVGDYKEGLAMILTYDEGGTQYYGYINKSGNEVIPPTYTEASDFNNGKALVKIKDDEYALINKKGQVITPINKPFVYGYQDGTMVYSDKVGGPQGYLDTKGEVIIPADFVFAEPFRDGVAVVGHSPTYRGEEGLIDKIGKWIYEPTYSDIQYLGEGRVALGKAIDINEPFKGSLYAIGDTQGRQLTNFIYYGVSDYEDGLASAYDAKETFFIGLDGAKITKLPSLEGAGTLKEKDNVITADVDNEVSYLTPEGKVIYEPNDRIKLSETQSVLVEKYRPNVNYLVYYPQVELRDQPKVAEQINLALKTISIPEKVQPDQNLDYTYTGDFSVQFYNQDLFIPRIGGSTYYFGAAHPLPTRMTPSINLKTSSIYKLSDLFKPDSMWQAKLTEIIQNMAQNDPIYKDILFEPIDIKLDENQSFYVDQEHLIIYYAPYDIGPYSSGYINFKIPFTEIEHLINKEGSFWQSFH